VSQTPVPAATPVPKQQPVVTTPHPTAPPAPPLPASVRIIDFAFSPSSLSVHVGQGVTWTNRGMATHTVTNNGGLFNSGSLRPNQSFTFTFMSRGTYAYHCQIHMGMTGTITVTG